MLKNVLKLNSFVSYVFVAAVSLLSSTNVEAQELAGCSAGETVVADGFGWLKCGTSPARFLSIPSSAFTPRSSADGWTGNETGTNRNFGTSGTMFAPVHLPHQATVTSLACGGFDAAVDVRLRFILRRNQAQVANVDMAITESAFDAVGFQNVSTSDITSPQINNRGFFNYYVVAEVDQFDVGICKSCTVGYCRIGYTVNVPYP